MMKPKISLIAALSENRVIGKEGKIPWHISEDLRRFKKLTQGHVIIMGRKTYESIGRLLPDRTHIVITRDQNYQVKGAIVSHSLDEAIKNSQLEIQNWKLPNEIFIIGGAQIYAQALQFADKLYLTIVRGKFQGDAFFPDYSEFKKIIEQKIGKEGRYEYEFIDLEK